MGVTVQTRPSTIRTVGGAVVALAGLLQLVRFATADLPGIAQLAAVALAAGCVVLAFGPYSIVGASRIGRVALVVLGVGPLVDPLPLQLTPWSVVIGMSEIMLLTLATVVAAATVAGAGVLHGVARWALFAVAVDAVLTAVMSTVRLGDLPFLYLAWHAELIRPLALLVWGVAVALHGRVESIRRRGTAVNAAWKRSTDVGGAATGTAGDVDARL